MKWLILFFLLILPQVTFAVGIVTDYLNENTLTLIDGTSTTYKILLQNIDQQEVDVKLGMDSEIASIVDHQEIYTLPPGVSNTPVYLNITPPKGAKIGEVYTISYYMEPVPTGGGTVAIGLRMNKELKVRIERNPDKLYADDYFARASIIGVLLIIGGVVLKKKLGSRKDKIF